MSRIVLVFLGLAVLLPAASDVEAVKAEPNLERRSALALDKAEARIGDARKAYEGGDLDQYKAHLEEAGQLGELCYQSLQDSGKRARKSPKWFKHAEQKLLVILRRLDSLVKDTSVDDRAPAMALDKRLRDVHEQVLQDIMTKK